MARRKMTSIEIALDRASEDALDAVEAIGAGCDYSAEFRECVRDAFGSDFLDIYDEWAEEGQSDGVPQ